MSYWNVGDPNEIVQLINERMR